LRGHRNEEKEIKRDFDNFSEDFLKNKIHLARHYNLLKEKIKITILNKP